MLALVLSFDTSPILELALYQANEDVKGGAHWGYSRMSSAVAAIPLLSGIPRHEL